MSWMGLYHLETKGTVDHEENEVGNLANVDHAVEVVVALDEGQTTLLAGDDGDGALGLCERLFCVAPDETLEEGGLADACRPDNGDDDWRGLVVGSAVDEGDVQTGLVPLSVAATLLVCAPS